jgi:hypothetical protein
MDFFGELLCHFDLELFPLLSECAHASEIECMLSCKFVKREVVFLELKFLILPFVLVHPHWAFFQGNFTWYGLSRLGFFSFGVEGKRCSLAGTD